MLLLVRHLFLPPPRARAREKVLVDSFASNYNSNYILIVTSSKALVSNSFLLLLVRHLLLLVSHLLLSLFPSLRFWTQPTNYRESMDATCIATA